jgi:hypothetical protein
VPPFWSRTVLLALRRFTSGRLFSPRAATSLTSTAMSSVTSLRLEMRGVMVNVVPASIFSSWELEA